MDFRQVGTMIALGFKNIMFAVQIACRITERKKNFTLIDCGVQLIHKIIEEK